MWKRNQSMMAEMSKRDLIHRLLYVNPTVWLRGNFIRTYKAFAVSLGIRRHFFASRVSPKITVYQPMNFIPLKRKFPILKKVEDQIMLKVIRHLNRGERYILFMNCPNISSHYVLDRLLESASLSIFDFSDDFAELGYDEQTKARFRQNATKYCQVAKLVLTVNEHIKDKYSYLNSNIQVMRNATNYENFNRQTYKSIHMLERFRERQVPIIGYSGTANMGRIDKGILDFLLEQRSNWQFVFVGPAQSHFVERYANCQNVHILPSVNYQDLPCYLQYFDVAIVPFQKNEHTKGNDLLKLHDYLAMGKPVVSTDIGGANDLEGAIRIAQSPPEFLNSIEELLANNCSEEIAKRKCVALENSWHTRVSELETLIKINLELEKGSVNR